MTTCGAFEGDVGKPIELQLRDSDGTPLSTDAFTGFTFHAWILKNSGATVHVDLVVDTEASTASYTPTDPAFYVSEVGPWKIQPYRRSADGSVAEQFSVDTLFVSASLGLPQEASTSAPAFTSPPSIAGIAEVGQTLTVTPGVVMGVPTPSVTRTLLRDGVDSGSVGLTYDVVLADVGTRLSVREDAVSSAGSASSTSGETGVVVDTSALPSGTQLLDFDGTVGTFARGLEEANGDASARTSASAFVDLATNVLRTEMLADVARFLFEGERTNFAPNADTLNVGYTKVSGTVTEAQHAAPNGVPSAASEITISAASGRVYPTVANASTEDNQRITHSVWIRHISGGNKIRFSLRGRDNVLIQGGAEFDVGTEWERIEHTWDIGAGATSPQFWLQGGSSGMPGTFAVFRNQIELGRYPTSGKASSPSPARYADSLTFNSDEVPEHLRATGFACNIRPLWASDDLIDGDRRALLSFGPSDWVGFERDAGSAYLRCYTDGVLRFSTGALTIARDTDYAVECDLAAGVMTFGGVAGTSGTAVALPGGVAMRWGGMMGVDGQELDGATTEPEVA